MPLPLLAAISQRRVAAIVVLLLLLGWVIYLISTARRTYVPGSEMEVAPNRKPYYSDEVLEGPRLTRFLWWAFACLAILAVGLPAYWMREPFRQAGAGFDRGTAYFHEEAIKRGKELYETFPGDPPTPREPHFGCDACHGREGVGGVASYTITDPTNPDNIQQVQWVAPRLDTVMLRYRPEEVRTILIYGRPNTPMPAWGVDGGGPMNDQQINDLIAYLTHLTRNAREVQAEHLERYGTDGQQLYDAFCARCHTQGFTYGEPGLPGGGAFGPALTAGATLRQFPTPELHYQWIAETAEFGDAYGVRGVSSGRMPFFENELTREQIQAIVDYERSLP
ncbi:MAG TPA: cytochrome c [Acidimicrobiales bacterium]|nr:cytochrome c [Acidimicrobiales bacterium]